MSTSKEIKVTNVHLLWLRWSRTVDPISHKAQSDVCLSPTVPQQCHHLFSAAWFLGYFSLYSNDNLWHSRKCRELERRQGNAINATMKSEIAAMRLWWRGGSAPVTVQKRGESLWKKLYLKRAAYSRQRKVWIIKYIMHMEVWCVAGAMTQNVLRKSPKIGEVTVLSVSFYPFLRVIWCSKKANSLKCLSHQMDIWQRVCVTHAIYGISETVFTLYLHYQGRKLEINNLIQEAAGIYESKPDSVALNCGNLL